MMDDFVLRVDVLPDSKLAVKVNGRLVATLECRDALGEMIHGATVDAKIYPKVPEFDIYEMQLRVMHPDGQTFQTHRIDIPGESYGLSEKPVEVPEFSSMGDADRWLEANA